MKPTEAIDKLKKALGAGVVFDDSSFRATDLFDCATAMVRGMTEWTLTYRTRLLRRPPTLPVVESISLETFESEYRNQRPFVIRPAHPPTAVTRWTVDYITSVFAKYTDEHGTLNVGRALINKYDPSDPRTVDQDATMVKPTLAWLHQLFAKDGPTRVEDRMYYRSGPIQELWQDLADLPGFIFEQSSSWRGARLNKLGVWFGPAGNRTIAHRDPWHGFLFQVRGRKRVCLVAPHDVDNLYLRPGSADRSLPQVDFCNPDFAKYPRFRDVVVLDHTLQPGELVYLPPFWFHDVTCVDHSISSAVRVLPTPAEAFFHPIRIDNLMHGNYMAW